MESNCSPRKQRCFQVAFELSMAVACTVERSGGEFSPFFMCYIRSTTSLPLLFLASIVWRHYLGAVSQTKLFIAVKRKKNKWGKWEEVLPVSWGVTALKCVWYFDVYVPSLPPLPFIFSCHIHLPLVCGGYAELVSVLTVFFFFCARYLVGQALLKCVFSHYMPVCYHNVI